MLATFVDRRARLRIVMHMMRKEGRIDLHTHTILSDGALLPSELLRRADAMQYRALALTDHVDAGNLENVIRTLQRVRRDQANDFELQFIIGVEITHVAPASIARLAKKAKDLGAEIIVVHGETIVEPVAPGTNRAAIDCEAVDLLAHPGFLTPPEAQDAAARGCFVEITARKGHSLTNGHVARVCMAAGAQMVIDTDTHEPGDLITLDMARRVALGAGLPPDIAEASVTTNPVALMQRVMAPHGEVTGG